MVSTSSAIYGGAFVFLAACLVPEHICFYIFIAFMYVCVSDCVCLWLA